VVILCQIGCELDSIVHNVHSIKINVSHNKAKKLKIVKLKGRGQAFSAVCRRQG